MSTENNATTKTTTAVKVNELVLREKIYIVRGEQVMLDSDLADIYGYETRYLNLQVKRNSSRFPDDFMFQLTKEEYDALMLQISTSNRGGRRTLPYAGDHKPMVQCSAVRKGHPWDAAESRSV